MNTALKIGITFLFSTNASAITQFEFVERLKSVHPFFTQQNFTKQASQLDYIASTSNQDWMLSVSVDSSNTLNQQTSSSTLGVTHNLVDTGADITISNIWSDGIITDKLSIDYVHPLLKGANGINDQLLSDLSKLKVAISALKIAQNEESFVLLQLYKLIDLSYAQQQILLTTSRLKLTQQELSLVKAKFEQSVVDVVDVFLQEDAYQRALQKQLQAEQTLDLLKEELSIVLNMSVELIYSDYKLYQLYRSNLNNLDLQLRQHSTEMKLARLEQTLLQRQLLSDKSNIQVQLDLKLGVSNANDNDWNIGLELSYPLGDTKAKSALEKTQINLAKAKENTKEQLIKITIKARVLNKKITHLAKLLDTYQTRIKIAESRSLAEKKRYELGNSQMSFVISAQNNVHDVNLAYAQAAVNYQKSVLEFKAVIDQLL